jgi:hypothetical protein
MACRIDNDAGQRIRKEDEKRRRKDQRLPGVAFEQVFSLFCLSGFGLFHRFGSADGFPGSVSPPARS